MQKNVFIILLALLFCAPGFSQNQNFSSSVLKPVKRPVTVLTQQNLRPRDGMTTETAGYKTVGDGGSNRYLYHSTGRSGVTIRGGFFIAGAGVDDYFEAIDKSVSNVKQFGAAGDGVTDDTDACRNAMAATPNGGRLYFPPGVYPVDGLTLANNRVIDIYGPGAKLISTPAATGSILNLGTYNNANRDNVLRISGLEINGNDVAGVTGVSMGFRTNLHFENLEVTKCPVVGLDCKGALNLKVQDCLVHRNGVGVDNYPDLTGGGGGNANSFINVECYANKVGVICDQADTNFPIVNFTWIGGTVQENSFCGMAMYSVESSVFSGTHFERNGTQPAGSTYSHRGRDIPVANIYLTDRSRLTFIGAVREYQLENYSTMSVSNVPPIGNINDIWGSSNDHTGRVFLNESIGLNGFCSCRVDRLPDRFDVGNKGGFQGLPIQIPSRITNLSPFPRLIPVTKSGSVVLNPDVVDPEYGLVTSFTLPGGTAGSISHRALVQHATLGTGTVFTGDFCAITLLAKSNRTQTVRFNSNAGNHFEPYVALSNEWQRIVIVFKVSTLQNDSEPQMSIYADGTPTADTTIQICNLHTHKIGFDDDDQALQDIVCRGAFNSNQNGREIVTDTDYTISPNSKVEIEFKGTLTANRTISLPAAGYVGEEYFVYRSADGAFDLTVTGVATLDSPGDYIRLRYDGANWNMLDNISTSL